MFECVLEQGLENTQDPKKSKQEKQIWKQIIMKKTKNKTKIKIQQRKINYVLIKEMIYI